MKRLLVSLFVFFAFSPAVLAADTSITLPPDDSYAELKPGPGVEVARANCVLCHSTDYIVMQPRGDATQWQAVVTKMIRVYGAVINEQDAKTIVEYLASSPGPANEKGGIQ